MDRPIKTFTISDKTDPVTGKPFGEKYAGTFRLHRPSIGEKRDIAALQAKFLDGALNVADWWDSVSYVVALLWIASEKEDGKPQVPKWATPAGLYDLYEDADERALMAAWQEVRSFLNSFRPKDGPAAGAEGGV